jgi:hypothetical protein
MISQQDSIMVLINMIPITMLMLNQVISRERELAVLTERKNQISLKMKNSVRMLIMELIQAISLISILEDLPLFSKSIISNHLQDKTVHNSSN